MRKYIVQDYICMDCGSIKEPYIFYTWEFKDRDGNRGVKTRVYKCADCGHEYFEFLH